MSLTPQLTGLSHAVAVRRDLRRVERKLRELAEPRGEVPDLAGVRAELARLLGALTVYPTGAEARAAIDGYVDSHVAEFLGAMREHHDARLGRLDMLDARVAPHLARIRTLMKDELAGLELLDAVIANLTLQAANPEKPITYTRAQDQLRERHR